MEQSPIQREKLLNAIIFFTKNTRNCYKLKLFKLLFYFDFQVYRETGKSPTGLDYFAWPMGPVPARLHEELDAPKPDMKSALSITRVGDVDPDLPTPRLQIKPRHEFDDGCFTPRELKAMQRLAEVYLEATAAQMTEVSHLPGQPWHRIYEVERRPQALIPHGLALDGKPGSISRDQEEQIAEEERAVRALFG